MSVIKPTVGRVVLFVPRVAKHEFGFCFCKDKEHAAIITTVHSDRLINVAAFDANGKSYGFTSITLLQEDDTPEKAYGADYCKWMEFQIGQAKRTEDLAQALAEKQSSG